MFYDKSNQIKQGDSLAEALIACEAFAEQGHALASDAVSLLSKVKRGDGRVLRNYGFMI